MSVLILIKHEWIEGRDIPRDLIVEEIIRGSNNAGDE
jgi:hypothetical protein